MKGLFGINQCVKNFSLHSADFSFDVETNSKFKSDKIFTENEHFVIGLDGVILNKSHLVKSSNEWINYFIENLDDLPNKLNQLKGNFHGFIYNKLEDELILFNDPIGNKNFCYYFKDNVFAFHHSDIDLIHLLKERKLSLQIEKRAIYSFLAYGFLTSELSWCENCFRLNPGTILKFSNQKVSITRYKEFKSEPENLKSKKQLLDEFEHHFSSAVELQYNKDIEEDYTHYATLSGGLDSRATVLMANKLGFTEQTTFTCSQSGYDDETIARKIAKSYGFSHQFYALDKFQHLFEIEKTMNNIGGSALYSGPAHVIKGIEKYWDKPFGLIHTGHIGDGVMGGFIHSTKNLEPDLNFGRINEELLKHNSEFDERILNNYTNVEEFKLYERAFCGTAAGVWGLEQFSYNISPFADKDVLDFLLKVPFEYKIKRKIYIEWLLKLHPEWTQFPLESLHSKPNHYWKFKYQKTYLRLRFGYKKLSRNYRLKNKMVPEQFWFEKDSVLQNYFREEFEIALNISKELNLPYTKEIEQLYESSDFTNHSKALHLGFIVNLIYSE